MTSPTSPIAITSPRRSTHSTIRQQAPEALRHVLVGGTPSVQAFADEIAQHEGGDPLPPHTATGIIGEVLAQIDTRDT